MVFTTFTPDASGKCEGLSVCVAFVFCVHIQRSFVIDICNGSLRENGVHSFFDYVIKILIMMQKARELLAHFN